jgi:hypothetical protein
MKTFPFFPTFCFDYHVRKPPVCQQLPILRNPLKISTMGAGLLNGSLLSAFVALLLKLRTVFFPVQTQFAGARSLWSVLQEKTACAARATA